MKVEWNKVTWYSKIVALALFVAFPFIGFWFGIQLGETTSLLNDSVGQIATSTQPAGGYYANVAEWQTDSRTDGGFSMAYPLDFQVDDNYSSAPVTDWRLGGNGIPGQKLVTIVIPRMFEPQTNFADATLTVGKSSTTAATADCMKPDATGIPGDSGGTTLNGATTTINGITFMIFKSAGVGAGNYYETTSYRTLHAGACYAVEYTIHSTQIMNYPAEYNLTQFNQGMLTDVLDRMVGTFRFL